MQVSIKGRQFRIGEALHDHIDRSIQQIATKYFGNPIEAAIVMSREGTQIRADISVHVGRGIQIHGQAQAAEPYAAFDGAGERIDKRLRRHKRRLRDHHRGEGSGRASARQDGPATAQQYVLAAGHEDEAAPEPEDWQPVVVAEMSTPIETLSVGEAVMRMDFGDLPLVMFRNPSHGELNVIYRREDGNIGWIDPKGGAGR